MNTMTYTVSQKGISRITNCNSKLFYLESGGEIHNVNKEKIWLKGNQRSTHDKYRAKRKITLLLSSFREHEQKDQTNAVRRSRTHRHHKLHSQDHTGTN